MKKCIIVCLSAVLSIVLLVGCGNKPTPTGLSSQDENLTAIGETKIVNEKITLTAFTAPFPEVKLVDYAYEDNQFTKWLEDQTNIHIDWQLAPSSAEISTKLSLLISANQMPDICFQNGFTPSMQQLYGAQGLIEDLSTYIDKYGVNTKKMFTDMPEIKAAITLNEGKIYVLPSYAEDTHMKSFYKMWIYEPWLKKLGLPVPKTTDEFYNTLIAFRDLDPNGNKLKDEIPMLGCTVWNSWNPTTYLMNAFTYYDPNTKMSIVDGKVTSAINNSAYKNGLKFMRKLYDENLMSQQTFTMDFNQFKQTVESSEVPLVGVIPSHAPFVAATTRYVDYIPLDPLIGPDGTQFAHYNYITQNMGVVISSKCKNPVAAFRMLDYLYSEEATIRSTIGREKEEWAFTTSGEGVGNTGTPAIFKDLTSNVGYDLNKGVKNIYWYMIANYYKPTSFQNKWLITEKDASSPATQLTKSTLEQYIPHQPAMKNIMPQTILLTEEQSAQIADIEVALSDYATESFAEFALGLKDIDSEWDNYVSELDNLGIKTLIEVYQASIDAK